MRVSRTTGVMSGMVIVVLGVWGGLIPFTGPYFNFSFGPDVAWHYTTNRLWLDILPGAVAVIGGLMIMFAGNRINGAFGVWVALAAGAWFAVGPAVSQLWAGSGNADDPIGAPTGNATRQMLELVGYFYGVGVLIVGFAAFSLGRFVSRRARPADEPAPPPADRGAGRPLPADEQPTTASEQPTTVGEQPTTADEQPTTVP